MWTLMRQTARWAVSTLPLLALLLSPAAAQEPLEPQVTHVSPGEDVSVLDASLSPDGRWIVYSRMLSETSASLWVIPSAGGEPIRLTEDGYWEDRPSWSPDGFRVFFRSNRSARAGDWRHYGMVLGFDPSTGRPTGSARRLTVDDVSGPPPIQASPDGRFVAYFTREGGNRLQVIPATGGQARTVAELEGNVFNLRWSDDGRELLFTQRPGQRAERIAYRVSAEGGTPAEVFRAEKNIQAIGPDGHTFALMDPGATPARRTIEVVGREGRVIARHIGDGNVRAWDFAKDGRTLVGTSTRVTAQMRVVPITGGRPMDVTGDGNYDWHAQWTEDGSELLVFTNVNDEDAIVKVPRAGGSPRAEPLTLPDDEEEAEWSTAGGDFGLYTAKVPGTDRRRLVAVNRHDGSRHVLTESFRRIWAVAPGGIYGYLGGDEFLFAAADGERAELRVARPGAEARVLRSVPLELADRTTFAVHGERVAWFEEAADGDSVHLLLSPGPTAEPHRLLTMPAGSRCCRFNLSFSPNGTRLLTEEPEAAEGLEGNMLLLELGADGRRVRNRRTFDTGAYYWYEPQWLPDGSGVTVLAGYQGLRTHVVLVRFREGESPVIVTSEDPSPKWGQMLSPDGRYVAYPGEVWRGGSIWTMDLSAVQALAPRRR